MALPVPKMDVTKYLLTATTRSRRSSRSPHSPPLPASSTPISVPLNLIVWAFFYCLAMGKTPKSKSAKATASPSHAPTNRAAVDRIITTNLKAPATRKTYAGTVERGREWLASHVAVAVVPPGSPPDYLEILSRSFDDVPNMLSPEAVAMHLVEKCEVQGKSKSTADAINAAFKDLWTYSCVIVSLFIYLLLKFDLKAGGTGPLPR